jgi:hypothetical protein
MVDNGARLNSGAVFLPRLLPAVCYTIQVFSLFENKIAQ